MKSEDLFEKQGRPVDRHIKVRITRDSEGNESVEFPEKHTIELGHNGSTDRLDVEREYHFHCGHFRGDTNSRDGGICREDSCLRVSCSACYGRCLGCGKGLCLEHSYYQPGEQGQRMCLRCFNSERRRLRSRRVLRILLSPFVDFED